MPQCGVTARLYIYVYIYLYVKKYIYISYSIFCSLFHSLSYLSLYYYSKYFILIFIIYIFIYFIILYFKINFFYFFNISLVFNRFVKNIFWYVTCLHLSSYERIQHLAFQLIYPEFYSEFTNVFRFFQYFWSKSRKSLYGGFNITLVIFWFGKILREYKYLNPFLHHNQGFL